MNHRQVSSHTRIAAGSCISSHTIRKAVIYDHEDDGTCYMRGKGEEISPFDFTLQNSKGKLFHFVKVDKCMFSDEEDGTRCDCLVFTDEVSLFIEFKSNKSVSGRQKGRKKARGQLQASIEWFIDENLLTDGETVEVIVNNGTRRRHPSFTASIIDKTTELQKLFPNLDIQYKEQPYYKL